jgi:hypothetical protein
MPWLGSEYRRTEFLTTWSNIDCPWKPSALKITELNARDPTQVVVAIEIRVKFKAGPGSTSTIMVSAGTFNDTLSFDPDP